MQSCDVHASALCKNTARRAAVAGHADAHICPVMRQSSRGQNTQSLLGNLAQRPLSAFIQRPSPAASGAAAGGSSDGESPNSRLEIMTTEKPFHSVPKNPTSSLVRKTETDVKEGSQPLWLVTDQLHMSLLRGGLRIRIAEMLRSRFAVRWCLLCVVQCDPLCAVRYLRIRSRRRIVEGRGSERTTRAVSDGSVSSGGA